MPNNYMVIQDFLVSKNVFGIKEKFDKYKIKIYKLLHLIYEKQS